MKKAIIVIILAVMTMSVFAQKQKEKKHPVMYSGEFYGIPVKLELPFGKHEQIYAVPLAEEVDNLKKSQGGAAAVFLCTDTLVFNVLQKIGRDGGDDKKKAVLYGVRIDPFHNWGKVQQQQAVAVLGKGSVKELKKLIWLDLTSYDPKRKISESENLKKLFE